MQNESLPSVFSKVAQEMVYFDPIYAGSQNVRLLGSYKNFTRARTDKANDDFWEKPPIA